ncbi:hypothetical protein OS493_022907 [Desmophyllum pertusum]|uniref:Uncharacterized protein n=1 Tax=Desmophyllum pertusum TaxID=174260 RepID=A0A9W9ZM68_9CNID|nr:hypothetical protein OS493_022907 [Desmophyllum pertusum]
MEVVSPPFPRMHHDPFSSTVGLACGSSPFNDIMPPVHGTRPFIQIGCRIIHIIHIILIIHIFMVLSVTPSGLWYNQSICQWRQTTFIFNGVAITTLRLPCHTSVYNCCTQHWPLWLLCCPQKTTFRRRQTVAYDRKLELLSL